MSGAEGGARLAELRARLDAARAGFAELPGGPGRAGPVDPETGEAWTRANALGHLAEAIAYWTPQVAEAAAGRPEVGRDPAGRARRAEGIHDWALLPEAELGARLDSALAAASATLAALDPGDLGRPLVFVTDRGRVELDLGEFIRRLLVVHSEEHLAQVREMLG